MRSYCLFILIFSTGNLKQLALTPKNVVAMLIKANWPNVSCAALGNNATGVYSI